MPMRDAKGENIGLIVCAYKAPVQSNAGERDLKGKAFDLRDALARRIPSHAALFAPAR